MKHFAALHLALPLMMAAGCTGTVSLVEGHGVSQELDLLFAANRKISVEFVTPTAGQTVDSDKVAVKIKVDGYPLGRHVWGTQQIDIVLDGVKLKTILNPDVEVVFEGLSPGAHVLQAFPIRPWGETIKRKGAFRQVTFYAALKTDPPKGKEKICRLTYVRPRGLYRSYHALRIIFDFALDGCVLSPAGHRLKYKLNNLPWVEVGYNAPIWFEDLPDGKHEIAVQLIDRKGNLVPGPSNNVRHTFEVRR